MTKRKYTVSGTDTFGDVIEHHTDNPERAQAKYDAFAEDLENLTLEEH